MSINDHLVAVLALPGCGGGLVREPDLVVIAESAEVEPAMIELCQPRHWYWWCLACVIRGTSYFVIPCPAPRPPGEEFSDTGRA